LLDFAILCVYWSRGVKMKYRKVPKYLIEETKRIIRMHQFLRYDCGLKLADKLSAKNLKKLGNIIGIIKCNYKQ